MTFGMRLVCLVWAAKMEERNRVLVELLLEMIKVQDELLRSQNGGRRKRFSDSQRLRVAVKAAKVPRNVLAQIAEVTFSPATFLRWYKTLVGAKYDDSANRKRKGRPRIKSEHVDLICRLARENPGWGYLRIAGELKKLDVALSKNSVARVLKEHGLESSPQRLKGKPWRDFLKQHWETLYAVDFFTIEVLRLFGTIRYHVAIVINLKTRQVHLAGMVPEPDQQWTVQMARNLTDYEDGFLKDGGYLIHDRATVFGTTFKRTLKAAGVRAIKLPPQSPNLNAHLERFNRSIKEECLNHFIICSPEHLEHLVKTYIDHYNSERPHQGLDNNTLKPEQPKEKGPVTKTARLGGVLNHYHRNAA